MAIHTNKSEPTQSISEKGIMLIKGFEGYRDRPYYCAGGHLTIGHGSTLIQGHPVKMSSKIDKKQADVILREHLKTDCAVIPQLANGSLSQHQFDALCSLVYNIGPTAFAGSSLANKLKTGRIQEISTEFQKWDKIVRNGRLVKLAGLVSRRNMEKDIYIHGYK